MLTIGDLLLKLENAGEVGVGVAEHKLLKNDAGGVQLTAQTSVAYVLDAMKSEKRKKAKKAWFFWSFVTNHPNTC